MAFIVREFCSQIAVFSNFAFFGGVPLSNWLNRLILRSNNTFLCFQYTEQAGSKTDCIQENSRSSKMHNLTLDNALNIDISCHAGMQGRR